MEGRFQYTFDDGEEYIRRGARHRDPHHHGRHREGARIQLRPHRPGAVHPRWPARHWFLDKTAPSSTPSTQPRTSQFGTVQRLATGGIARVRLPLHHVPTTPSTPSSRCSMPVVSHKSISVTGGIVIADTQPGEYFARPPPWRRPVSRRAHRRRWPDDFMMSMPSDADGTPYTPFADARPLRTGTMTSPISSWTSSSMRKGVSRFAAPPVSPASLETATSHCSASLPDGMARPPLWNRRNQHHLIWHGLRRRQCSGHHA